MRIPASPSGQRARPRRRRGGLPHAAMRRERPRGVMWAGVAMAHTPADVGIYKKKSATIRPPANRIAAVIMLRTVNTAAGAAEPPIALTSVYSNSKVERIISNF